MNYRNIIGILSAGLIVGCQSATYQEIPPRAETAPAGKIEIAIDHNNTDAATAGFRFKSVAPPEQGDAAATAEFSVADGTADPNGGGLAALGNDRLPSEEDQPSGNFFFAAGTKGGRVSVDLGREVNIKAVRTYSWHPGARGPQVYKLYASDGKASGFEMRPKAGVDPETCGWKHVANVDTRTQFGDAGGQYGVSIANSRGTIGEYRYLLLDCSATENDDAFGNTFYSELDVVDANGSAPKAIAASTEAAPFVMKTADGKCEFTINTARAPELKEWAETKLAPVLAEWYPKISAILASDGFTPPSHFSVTLRPGSGVAATGGTRVTGNSTWFKNQLKGEAVGALLHEEVHVVQQYRWGRRSNPNATRPPGWMVEGIPDYIRWFKYEPQSHGADIVWMRTRRNFTPRYDASYRVSANFLNWITEKYDKDIVTQMNAAMRNGDYSEDLWKKYTGKTVEELGAEWKKDIRSPIGSEECCVNARKVIADHTKHAPLWFNIRFADFGNSVVCLTPCSARGAPNCSRGGCAPVS